MKFQNLDKKQLSQVLGGARPRRGGGKYHYYGNSVSCNRYHCRVDWSRSWYCIANRAAGAYATGGRATIGNC